MDPSLLSPDRIGHRIDQLLYVGYLPGVTYNELNLEWQDASIKAVVTHERLKRWNLWERSVSQHRRDALAHLTHRVRILLDSGALAGE